MSDQEKICEVAGADLCPPQGVFCNKCIPEERGVDVFDFSFALPFLKRGKKISRLGWNGKGMWLQMQVPDENSKMTLPYIYIEYPFGHIAYPQGCRVPWLASQTDLLAEDWVIVE